MSSTGWRTACTVIVIIVGAALLTFAVYVYRRQRLLRRFPNGPDMMQQRFMHSASGSYAGDPEAHMPLLNTEAFPPLPPKTEPATHHRNLSSGDWGQVHHFNNASSLGVGGGGMSTLNDSWGTKVRGPPARVPVPPLFPEPMVAPAEQQRYSFPFNPDPDPDRRISMSMPEPEPASAPAPEPTPRSPLFHLPQLSFPRIQIRTDSSKKGRIPSLRIEFLRESNQVVSSPAADAASAWTHVSRPASSVSAPSTRSRPFATMALASSSSPSANSNSPLPPIPRVSPISTIDIARQSPSLPPAPSSAGSPPPPDSAVNSVLLSDAADVDGGSTPRSSVHDVGHNLFTRKLSTEDASFQTISRNSSAQAVSVAASASVSRTSSGVGVRPTSDPGRPKRTFSTSSGSSLSGSGSGSGSAASSGAGTNLRRATTWVPNVLASYSPWHGVVPGTGSSRGERVESPTGQIRVADAYRPMPTLEETPEATPATVPTALPGDAPESAYSYVAEGEGEGGDEDGDEDLLPLPPQLAAMVIPGPPAVRPPKADTDVHPAEKPPDRDPREG